MERTEKVIVKVSDNIISPLGSSTEANYKAVAEGKTMMKNHGFAFGVCEPFFGSLFDREKITGQLDGLVQGAERYTFFEKLCIASVLKALEDTSIDPASAQTIFILSTTKGNVDILEKEITGEQAYLSTSAEKIAEYFHNPNTPVVVSNACISGVCAQITAVRLLLSERYKVAVVVGCDVLSKFIISGFQSFKALSQAPCKPYDKDRTGLNLGEAVATMILASDSESKVEERWVYAGSSIHNDANHISGPSRTGEGSYRVLQDILEKVSAEEVAFINTHGTSTPYNDEMESIAIHRAEIDGIPVNGLKGYYGHTLGAAGLLETILSMKAVDNGLIYATKGFENQGTTYAVNVSNTLRKTEKKAFIKIISGFGGSNAGISYRKEGAK